MLIMGDRKKAVSAILGPKKEAEADAPEMDAGHAIAQEMIDAFHAKDAGALWDALKAACAELDAAPEADAEV